MEEYMNEPKASGGSFVAGLITGVLVGAGIAFILAPQTGEETRDFLRSKVREAGEQAGCLYEKGKVVIENAHGTIEANTEDTLVGI
jgi:gas vesicle protein